MFFSSRSATLSPSLTANSLEVPKATTALSASALSGLTSPLQPSDRFVGSSATVALNPAIVQNAIAIGDAVPIGDIVIPPIIFGTPGGRTLETATNLGSLDGTRSLYDLGGVSSTAPNDFYRVTLGENSNFNLSMTGLQADADVKLLNSLGEEIARSNAGGIRDEAINLSDLEAGDYYIHVYHYQGNSTSLFLDLSSTAPSNLLPQEFDLGALRPDTITRTGTISNANTSDIYHFTIDGFYRIGGGDLLRTGFDRSSNLNLSLTGLSADADVRIIRDSNHDGILDPGEEIVRSARGGFTSEAIELKGLGIGSYFIQVYQYAGIFPGTTDYTLSVSANGGSGFFTGTDDERWQAHDLHTLNGSRILSGNVSGRDPEPWTFDLPRDMNDYYRFDVGTTSNFSLSLTGLNGDADVALLDSSGIVLASSTRSGTNPESLNQTLSAGSYYVRVYPFPGNVTDYTLNLNAAPL